MLRNRNCIPEFKASSMQTHIYPKLMWGNEKEKETGIKELLDSRELCLLDSPSLVSCLTDLLTSENATILRYTLDYIKDVVLNTHTYSELFAERRTIDRIICLFTSSQEPSVLCNCLWTMAFIPLPEDDHMRTLMRDDVTSKISCIVHNESYYTDTLIASTVAVLHTMYLFPRVRDSVRSFVVESITFLMQRYTDFSNHPTTSLYLVELWLVVSRNQIEALVRSRVVKKLICVANEFQGAVPYVNDCLLELSRCCDNLLIDLINQDILNPSLILENGGVRTGIMKVVLEIIGRDSICNTYADVLLKTIAPIMIGFEKRSEDAQMLHVACIVSMMYVDIDVPVYYFKKYISSIVSLLDYDSNKYDVIKSVIISALSNIVSDMDNDDIRMLVGKCGLLAKLQTLSCHPDEKIRRLSKELRSHMIQKVS